MSDMADDYGPYKPDKKRKIPHQMKNRQPEGNHKDPFDPSKYTPRPAKTDFSDEFQQKNASSDAFEFAWGIAKGDNAPTNPSLWSQAKSKARAKFDVYPSAYANAWASKWYKSKGGGWKKKSKKGKK